MNNLANKLPLTNYIKHCFAILLFACSLTIQAQEIPYNQGREYTLGDITVLGNTAFEEQTIITYSGLRKGQEITIPGEDISAAIKKLWNSKLFSDIEIYITKVEGDTAFSYNFV